MKHDLETMVDKVGLSSLLFMLATVCSEKADHLRSNWQDENAAKQWLADAKAIEKVAAKLR